MDHPKFVAISANAWRLWCEGQSYCQKHLTDGVIPRQVLKGFRYYSPASMKMLTEALVPGKGPLWETTATGVQVHDYFDWNDSREEVLKARTEAKNRRRRWRDGHASMNASPDASPPRDATRPKHTNVSSGVVCSEERSSERIEPFESHDSQPTPVLAHRAGGFLQRYKSLYLRLRKVHYLGKPALDFQEAQELAAVFDDATLDKLAYVWLKTDHNFAENGTRTLAKFRSMATWCQERLNEWEAKHGRELVVNQ